MKIEKKNLSESVYSRLKNIALAKNCPTQEVLRYYAMERFLYRLSVSQHKRSFFLKGGLMLMVWDPATHRATVVREIPKAFSEAFYNTPKTLERWDAFFKGIGHDPVPLEKVIFEIKDFFLPILTEYNGQVAGIG